MNKFDDAMLDAIANGVEETVYVLADEDLARSADLLSDLCRRLHLTVHRDRARSKPPARKHPSRKTH